MDKGTKVCDNDFPCAPQPEAQSSDSKSDKMSSSSKSCVKEFKKCDCYCCNPVLKVEDEESPQEIPMQDYLRESVAPLISAGFQAVLQKLPPDPVTFLKNFYKDDPDQCQEKTPKHL